MVNKRYARIPFFFEIIQILCLQTNLKLNYTLPIPYCATRRQNTATLTKFNYFYSKPP